MFFLSVKNRLCENFARYEQNQCISKTGRTSHPVHGADKPKISAKKPPLCKGRWVECSETRRDCLAVICALMFDSMTICELLRAKQPLSLAFARQLPLHRGAFRTNFVYSLKSRGIYPGIELYYFQPKVTRP